MNIVIHNQFVIFAIGINLVGALGCFATKNEVPIAITAFVTALVGIGYLFLKV
jgi:hypothetical protein